MRTPGRVRAVMAAAIATLLMASACTGEAQPPGVVKLLVFGAPEELAAFRTLTEAYERAVPGADVQLIVASDAGDLITRLSTSIAGGAPPDIFLINYREYGQFAGRDAIEPVDERLSASKTIKAADFYPAPMEAFRWGGQQLCMPQNASSLAVYYNRTLFQQYGVSEPKPNWTWRPALPQMMFDWSALPISPTVARQRTSTRRISPEGIRKVAYAPSRPSSWMPTPADRANLAPPPGRSSTACTVVPMGMLRSGRLLPGLMSAPVPDSTRSPCFRSFGARMYRFSPSA